MIRLREIDLAQDYPIFEAWWREHGWPPVPAAILPKLGILAEADSQPIAAAWVYMDNSIGVSMCEWIVSNPQANDRPVYRAIKELIAFLKQRVKELGYGVMLATCKQESLSKLLQKQGFELTDESVRHHLALL